MVRDAKSLPHHINQIDTPPARQTSNLACRARRHETIKFLLLSLIELRRTSRRLPVNQTRRALGVETVNPVPQSLPIHQANSRGFLARLAFGNRRQRQQTPDLPAITRGPRQPA